MAIRNRAVFCVGEVYFVTTTVINKTAVFSHRDYARILCDNILHYRENYEFKILAYVIMPTHFHWVPVIDRERGSISDIMRDVKKFSAWDIMQRVEENGRTDMVGSFKDAAIGVRNQKRKFWSDRFDCVSIRNVDMLKRKIEYIHMNPVRAGLVERPEDYPFSSARDYILRIPGELPVDLDWWG